ncbi:MAG: plastocyanin/azurin family copper-binding protein [Gemmatimonadaceae bacterium]
MRFYGIALLASTVVLGACGGEKAATDTAAANAAAAAAATPSAMTPATTPATTPAGAATAAPATGTTHEVKMIGDATGYKYVPADITLKQGDAIKFIMVSGGPHNVAFQGITDPATKAQLDANMSGAKMGELSSPMLMQPNEAYTISFANVPAGKYDFICTPHAAMNMKGSVTVTK